MTGRQETRKLLRSTVFAFALAASVSAINGNARSTEIEDSTEVDAGAMEKALDAGPAQAASPGGAWTQQQRTARDAAREERRRRQLARTDRSRRKASQDPPIAVAAPSTGDLTGIDISFKLDSQPERGQVTAGRWIPPFFAGVQEGAEFTVEAKAQGRDTTGRAAIISPAWVASDPNMVEVSPGAGEVVKITVRDAGHSSLIVAAPGFTRELSISATYSGRAMHVQISQ